ncbi:hypothetical protein GUJ93_ZPchr0013g35133 [Zizania palustris]|uniref:Uncharacterized protein n=1 Tax=Zizania palustris TaxID=103762 RepID=A0A8J5WQL5_ZIZPA|nr:hypothetical protein GUJ93_ZPchr0013g35133 [Zizania palustris]
MPHHRAPPHPRPPSHHPPPHLSPASAVRRLARLPASAPLTPPRLALPPTTRLSPASAVRCLSRLPASAPLTPPDLALPPTTRLPASRPPPRSTASPASPPPHLSRLPTATAYRLFSEFSPIRFNPSHRRTPRRRRWPASEGWRSTPSTPTSFSLLFYMHSVSKERKEFLSLVNKEVTAVGINTEWGLLMASISEDSGEETPLQPYLLSETSPGLRELREELKDLRGDGIGFDIWM